MKIFPQSAASALIAVVNVAAAATASTSKIIETDATHGDMTFYLYDINSSRFKLFIFQLFCQV